jgi:hypothetical protein
MRDILGDLGMRYGEPPDTDGNLSRHVGDARQAEGPFSTPNRPSSSRSLQTWSDSFSFLTPSFSSRAPARFSFIR